LSTGDVNDGRYRARSTGSTALWRQRMVDPINSVDGPRIAVRRMSVEDAVLHDEFIARLEPHDLRFRFGSRISSLADTDLQAIAKVDHETETTFVATMAAAAGGYEIVGEVRLQADVEGASFEFAIAVRSDLQGRGLGRMLLEKAIACCRERRARLLYGLVNASNTAMMALARRLGFDIDEVPGGATVVVSLEM